MAVDTTHIRKMESLGCDILLLVLTTVLLMHAVKAQDIEEEQPVRWFFIKSKAGMEEQFGRAYREYLRHGGKDEFSVWQVETGDDVGQFVAAVCIRDCSWERLDNKEKLRSAANDQYHSDVAPYVQSISSIVTVFRPDISTSAYQSFFRSELVEVIQLELNQGGEKEFISIQREIRKAQESRSSPSLCSWHELANGGRRPTFFCFIAHRKWTDFQRGKQSLESLLVEAYGRDKALSLTRRLEHSISRTTTAVWKLRHDLSERGETAAVRPPEDTIPQFPWPPPKWSSRYVLPGGLVVNNSGEKLGIVFDRIRDALRRAAIYEWAVYAIGEDGFAVVSRTEHIEDDGSPKSGSERWNLTPMPLQRLPFRLDNLLKQLFSAQPGRYRAIVLVVTNLPVTATGKETTPQEWTNILRGGAGEPSAKMRETVLPPSVRCEALVYEFYRQSQDDPPKFVDASSLQAVDHLKAAGFWRKEELLP